MKINISEKIRAFRKAHKLTQEQLAEAMGVTVGAVSKWESGLSTPDLSLIVEMARFFETSVDVLLDYKWQSGSMGEAVKRIRRLRNEKQFREAALEAEKALLKYPNSFDVVYESALMYSFMGVECRQKQCFARAQTLLERSLELIEQNTDHCISEWSIRNNIAHIHLRLGHAEQGIEELKRNNSDGFNNGDIGAILATDLHRPDEALNYLSEALVMYVMCMFRITTGYVNAYLLRKEYNSAMQVLRLMLGILDGLKYPGKICYWDKMYVRLLTASSVVAAMQGDAEDMEAYLRRALGLAVAFDAAPQNGFANMRFFHAEKSMTGFDDFGVTAVESIGELVAENEANVPVLKETWNRLRSEIT